MNSTHRIDFLRSSRREVKIVIVKKPEKPNAESTTDEQPRPKK